MMPDTLPITRAVRHWAFAVSVACLIALAGCKTDKDTKGTGVARGKDPLVYGPNLIPKQNVPVPDRATGPNGPVDPLTVPTGGKAGYNDDPERFKGTFIQGMSSTPAALASRIKDGEELKITDTTAGVKLTPASGTLPAGSLAPPEDVEPLLAQLEKLGVAREDRSLERENGKFTFRASVPLGGEGARRQYVGVGTTARDAVKQVLDQLANDPKPATGK
jgi:hypothetical protein